MTVVIDQVVPARTKQLPNVNELDALSAGDVSDPIVVGFVPPGKPTDPALDRSKLGEPPAEPVIQQGRQPTQHWYSPMRANRAHHVRQVPAVLLNRGVQLSVIHPTVVVAEVQRNDGEQIPEDQSFKEACCSPCGYARSAAVVHADRQSS